jgi:hypothetical protein
MAEFALDQRCWHSHTSGLPGALACRLVTVDFAYIEIDMTALPRAFILPDQEDRFAFLQRGRTGPAGSGTSRLYIRRTDAHIVMIASSFCH